MKPDNRLAGFRQLMRAEGLPFALRSAAWKLRTALQKRWILLQDRYSLYTYTDWIRENEPRLAARQPEPAAPQPGRPMFSLLAPWEAPPPEALRALGAALAAQTHPDWEACLVLGEAASPTAREAAQALARRDPRCRLCPPNPGQPKPDLILAALEASTGEYILRLEAGDQPAPRLLAEVARRLAGTPRPQIVYCDEDHLVPDGRTRQTPFFKPDWSPELLLSTDYLAHAAFQRGALEQAWNQALAEAPDEVGWEALVLRCAESAQAIVHLPKVLYHAGPGATAAGASPARLRALAAHLQRAGLAAAQAAIEEYGQVRVTWPAGDRLVSIIIPTRDKVELLRKCVESIAARTRYPDYEIVLVDNGSQQAETHQYYDRLRQDPRVRRVEFPGEFNYSAANNLGARQAGGEILLFLNNDTEIINPDWLEELARWAARPEVGIVGAQLLYPDGTIQHAGIVVGMEGHGSHVFAGGRAGDWTPFGPAEWYRNVSAVTGACLAVRREVFQAIGGFDEAYQLVFNDIEICQRARAHGYRVVYTPYARLIHHEGQTRFSHIPAADIQLGYAHLKAAVARGDPYYNPNLSYAVRTPTFRRRFEDEAAKRLEAIARLYPHPAPLSRSSS